jgi:hypothetical protein
VRAITNVSVSKFNAVKLSLSLSGMRESLYGLLFSSVFVGEGSGAFWGSVLLGEAGFFPVGYCAAFGSTLPGGCYLPAADAGTGFFLGSTDVAPALPGILELGA